MTPSQVQSAIRWTRIGLVSASVGAIGLAVAAQWLLAAVVAVLALGQVFQLRKLSRYESN
jgi:hypothetical protein